MKQLTSLQAARLGGLELNALVFAQVLPGELYRGAQMARRRTPIYDLNGELLFYRVPMQQGRTTIGYTDIAANPKLGAVLLASSHGAPWDEAKIVKDAARAARSQKKGLRYDAARFVAYSYPKVAVQFLKEGKELAMIEWGTGKQVPLRPRREPGAPPSNFERWSLIDEMPAARARANIRKFEKRVEQWEALAPTARAPARLRRFRFDRLDASAFESALQVRRFTFDMRKLHYSTNLADHEVCYELRGQLTNVWCVAASTQMVLDFYRYNYAQTRIAQELQLGTLSNPQGLPYSRDGDVVTALQNLTGNALTASMTTTPNWNEFRDEIRANRPLISFIPGHSRTVAGYVRLSLLSLNFRGLLVYDPWPPTTGVITTWENFDASTYRRTFTAHVTLA